MTTRSNFVGVRESPTRFKAYKPQAGYCAVETTTDLGRFRFLVKLVCGREVLCNGENAPTRKSMKCACKR